jgi:uncharacterized protein (TIGR03118 family)
MDSQVTNRTLAITVLAILTLAAGAASGATIGYFQTNLTSDLPGLAPNVDLNLKNPWGMSFGVNSPFWISDQRTNVSTLYNAAGAPQALIVTTPPLPPPGPTGPTGQVFAGGLGFTMNTGSSAVFIFATLAGTIDAWNAGTSAVTQFTAPDGAVYTGLAQAGSLLYAADTRNGKIDVFNTSFAKTTVSGTFVDASVPAGFTPYDIQNVGGKLYVEYAQRNMPGGFVGVFDANGNFLQHISDPHLNGPWGVTMAPAGFGQFGNDLLVGNFGDGMINAFNPVTGAFLGTLSDAKGNPIVNSGLWALQFRSPAATSFDSNTLFFTAGINNQANGLFGEIQIVPEPTTLSMMGLGFGLMAWAWRKVRR